MIFESTYEERYWFTLMEYIENEIGVAALMGNLKDESNLIPYRKQGDFIPPYIESQIYTQEVDSGRYSKEEFINDSIGYGVAQWTFFSRKEKLFDFHIEKKLSIGSFELSIIMLIYELENNYKDVWEILRMSSDLLSASNNVLFYYLSPSDQGQETQERRFEYSREILEKYSGTIPPKPRNKKMPFWFYIRRRI